MATIEEWNWDEDIKARLVRLLKEGQADTDLVSHALNVLQQPPPPPFFILCKFFSAMSAMISVRSSTAVAANASAITTYLKTLKWNSFLRMRILNFMQKL